MKNLVLLHFVVLIFGFTGILGKLITIDSEDLVWYRMFFASIAIAFYMLLRKKSFSMEKKGMLQSLSVGLIIAAHWIFFFEAIKQSNVSITLAALSTASLFTAILEPILFKRRFQPYEILLGVLVIIGLYFIFQYETSNSIGIWLGIISALLASLFTVINGKMIKKYDSTRISLYELSGGVLSITLYLLFFKGASLPDFQMNSSDWIYLMILAIVCTAFAFVASVKVMEELTPFTVSLSINLEPVYGIILAVIVFGDSEQMSFGFYVGTLLIISSLFLNVWFKKTVKTN